MDSAVYLRKSRQEEGLETEEILARHQKALLDHAAKKGLRILETYYEVVSGESLYTRPEMLRLLADVEEGKYDAVLVMDLDRLSRGRMKDQGIILDAFRDSNTLIITPEKSYDLADEIDDELAEFKTFMSRREYKIINKRLRRGTIQSLQDGFHAGPPPYGYVRVYKERRATLEIFEDEAKFVRMMYDMYTNGYGCTSIARHVNLLGARPHRVERFGRSSVAQIIRNPIYTGKIVWNKKKYIRKGAKGNAKHLRIPNPEEKWVIADGAHPPIISQELFDRAEEIMSGRYTPSKKDGTIKSPLAGLVRCRVCGRNMQRAPNKKVGDYLLCMERGCSAATKYDLVEKRIIQHLQEMLDDLVLQQKEAAARPDTAPLEETLTNVRRERASAESQKSRLYELLELGEYDLQLFRERMGVVREKLDRLEEKEQEVSHKLQRIRATDIKAQIEKLSTVLASYQDADASGRNSLLHSIVDVVWYSKMKKTKPLEFKLDIELKPF